MCLSQMKTYYLPARELARKMILDVLASTGNTATAGNGTNLYLCKVAMDIVAKHIPAEKKRRPDCGATACLPWVM